jgi:hypothetical protein
MGGFRDLTLVYFSGVTPHRMIDPEDGGIMLS